MADKKITELTQLTSLASGDLFVVVDDPTGTPITKKITASDIFGNGISYVTNATYPAAVVLRSVLTANVNANTASANTLIAAEFVTNALGTSANTEYQYAVRAVSKLHEAAAKVTKEHAVAKFVLDDWDNQVQHFVKVFPRDYKQALKERKAKEAAIADK